MSGYINFLLSPWTTPRVYLTPLQDVMMGLEVAVLFCFFMAALQVVIYCVKNWNRSRK